MISMMQGIAAINPPLANTLALRKNPNESVFYGKGSPTKVQSRYNKIINHLIALEGEPLLCSEVANLCDVTVSVAQKNMLLIESDGFCSCRKLRRIVNKNSTTCLEFFIRT